MASRSCSDLQVLHVQKRSLGNSPMPVIGGCSELRREEPLGRTKLGSRKQPGCPHMRQGLRPLLCEFPIRCLPGNSDTAVRVLETEHRAWETWQLSQAPPLCSSGSRNSLGILYARSCPHFILSTPTNDLTRLSQQVMSRLQ